MKIIATPMEMSPAEARAKARQGGNIFGKALYGKGEITLRLIYLESREVILNIGYDVKEKFLALREAEKRIDVAKRSLVSARESYEAALGQYKAQMGTNFDVLDASSKLLTAQSSLTSARGDYLKALSELYLAMGEYHPDLL